MERDMKSEKGSGLKTPDDASIAFFKKRAIETADKQTPGLWQDLHSDLNRKEPLPIELATLLWRRLACEVLSFYTYIGILKINPELQDIYSSFLHGIEWVMTPEAITPLVKSVYNVFFAEIEEYRKKHKEDISQTILKAKEGDTKSRECAKFS
jgi:hypothetical protein